MALLLLCIASVLLCLGIALWPRWQARQRQRIGSQPFPSGWRRILRRRVPLVARLSPPHQRELQRLVQIFVAEKPFIGCGGMRITDEVRVTIAAQACMLLLGRKDDHFPALTQVLVYPDAFTKDQWRPGDDGVDHLEQGALSGESWTEGQVILSWRDVLEGAADAYDGFNVVVHEFAHQLDQVNGFANGAPPLGSGRAYARWSGVMQSEFDALRQQLSQGLETWLDPYAATSEAEFFAVASEAFIEAGAEMVQAHPRLYQLLRDFYGLDSASWA